MICSELNNSLIKLGFNSFTSQNFYEQLLFLNSFKDKSLMILFSKSEYTSEICELVKLSKKNNIKTILITDANQNNGYVQSDYQIIYYTCYDEPNYFPIMSNKMSQLIISDILVAMLIEKYTEF